MEQVLEGEPGERAVHAPVGRAEIVVEAGVDPRLEVAPAHLGVDVGRPRHGERIHAVLVLEQVGGVDAVLAPAARHQHVVAAVGAAVAVEQVDAAPARARPSPPASFSSAKRQAAHTPSASKWMVSFFDSRGVRVLDRGRRPLVGDHAAGAEAHVRGQAELGLERMAGSGTAAASGPGHERAGGSASPTSPLFSGWNWQPVIGPAVIAAVTAACPANSMSASRCRGSRDGRA